MGSETMGDHGLDEPPKYGLKLKLNHEFPLQSKQIIKPNVQQIFDLMPLFARYTKYFIQKKMDNKKPIMDYFNMISAQRMYGCPIGGIGGGTIGRGFKGEFCRFQMYPGIYEYVTVPECQFIVNIRNEKNETIFQSVLSTYNKPKKAPSSWEWNLDPDKCEYTGLYPRAWTVYDLSKYGVKLVCRQISPVIPHNYKDSSLPCAVFVFSATNLTNEKRDVSITFTWTEVLGSTNKNKTSSKIDLERYSEDFTCGVTLEQKVNDTPCTFTIAKKKQEDETIHEGYCLWNSSKTSSYVWECIKANGKLSPDPSLTPPPPKLPDGNNTEEKKEKPKKLYKYLTPFSGPVKATVHFLWTWLIYFLARFIEIDSAQETRGDSVALSSVICMDPGGSGSTEFCLNWDMPLIKYKKDKRTHRRYYTKYFGSDGIAGASMAAYALRNYPNWEKLLAEWQDPIFTNNNIPDWLKSALMNELYFVADGGTIWFDVPDEYPDNDPRNQFGLFGYLEGHEYRMYNTYDVHFYASFALAQLWPNLQVVLQYMYRDTIGLETQKTRVSLYDGKTCKYKVKDTVPHDLGDPDDEPFFHINCYNIHDVSEWKDLNLKFILQVLRDWRLLRAHSAPFGRRCDSMQYIDDVRDGGEGALLTRGAVSHHSTPAPTPARGQNNMQQEEAPPQAVPGILDLLYGSSTSPPLSPPPPSPADAEGGAGVWEGGRYLRDMYPACAALLRRATLWDLDDDGLIENSGFPDQTYDAWVMSGPSAYCGGLWLASISALQTMARVLGHEADEREFAALLGRAKQSYNDKLWAGEFYKFDTKPANKDVVMADQLAGHWFLRASGCNDQVFPTIRVHKSLTSIYQNNVVRWCAGKLGAVNGYVTGVTPRVDRSALQSEEAWTGVTYGLAATMIYEGMHEEAFATAGGMYETMVKMGLSFETPEAFYENGNHRSVAYMRPLAIWGIYQAIISTPPSSRRTSQQKTNGQAHHAKDL